MDNKCQRFERGGDTKDRSWIVDSGASQHITWSKQSIRNYTEFERPKWIRLGNGKAIAAYGDVVVRVREGGSIIIHDALFAPRAAADFVSVRVLSKCDYWVECKGNGRDVEGMLDTSV